MEKRLLPVVSLPLLFAISSCATTTLVDDGARVIRVPMELVNRTPVLTVRVNDIDVRLHLDTGSGATLKLYPSVIEKLKIVPTGEIVESIGIEGVTMYEPVYVVSRVEIGGATFDDVRIVQDDHTEEHRRETIQYRGTYGHVGRGLFNDHKLVIDYQDETLTLIPPDAPSSADNACGGIELPLVTDRDWGLTTIADTDIGDIYSVWDTGARGNIMVKAASDAAGLGLEARDQFETEKFVINGHDFGPIRMNIWDIPLPAEMNTILGYWFFSDKIVCVDFPRQRIFVRN